MTRRATAKDAMEAVAMLDAERKVLVEAVPEVEVAPDPEIVAAALAEAPKPKRATRAKAVVTKAVKKAVAKVAPKVAVDNRSRECSAPGCTELRATAHGICCKEHDYKWRHEGFRLTAAGTARAMAALELRKAAPKPATKAAKARVAKKAAAAKLDKPVSLVSGTVAEPKRLAAVAKIASVQA